MTPDADSIAARLALFVAPSQVTELRALHVSQRGRTFSGWFRGDQLREMARHALALSRQAAGVYFIPNPINPSLLARCENKTINVVRRGNEITPKLTTDADILERRYLMIDIDPRRSFSRSDVAYAATLSPEAAEQLKAAITNQHSPTTARELTFARRTAEKYIIPGLIRRGFTQPIIYCSGNGIHLVCRLTSSLPGGIADSQRDPLALKLRQLAAAYDCGSFTVDPNTFNAARMLKVPGTVVRKGEPLPHRPYRMARIIKVPDGWNAAKTGNESARDGLDSGPVSDPVEYVPLHLD